MADRELRGHSWSTFCAWELQLACVPGLALDKTGLRDNIETYMEKNLKYERKLDLKIYIKNIVKQPFIGGS